jgi:hypothetical protein
MQDLPTLDLTALTQLEDLVTDGFDRLSKLPTQLRSLKLTAVRSDGRYGSLQPLKELQQLQQLEVCIDVDYDATADVLMLTKRLQMLTHLALRYTYARDAAVASETWRQLPQLRELSFEFEEGVRVHRWEVDDIVAGVAAATTLTKLDFEAYCADEASGEEDDEDDALVEWECAPVAVCRQLSSLTGLRDLSFSQDTYLKPGDALWLTALTNLTRLVLFNMRDGVGDAAAAAIASSLTQLRHLDLGWCELGTDGGDLAEAVQQLVHLTELRLEGNSLLSRGALNNLLQLPNESLVRVTLDEQQSDLVDVEVESDRSDV